MSKKVKGAVLGGFSPVSEDTKARLKRETLMQEYQDLQKETFDMRMKLDAAKQRRGELLAEVRFLRRRHRYLLKIKSMERPEEQVSNRGKNQNELTTKGHKSHKNEVARFKLPPLPVLKPKGRVYDRIAPKNMSSALDLNHKVASLQNGKDASQRNTADVSYRKRIISSDNDAAVRNTKPTFYSKDTDNFQGGNGGMGSKIPAALDLNLDGSVVRNEAVLPNRIPTFDLNVASMEEEEVQVGYEPKNFEESKMHLIRAGYDEQASDINISACRNSGEGSSRIGKRKISWQDPVALRV